MCDKEWQVIPRRTNSLAVHSCTNEFYRDNGNNWVSKRFKIEVKNHAMNHLRVTRSEFRFMPEILVKEGHYTPGLKIVIGEIRFIYSTKNDSIPGTSTPIFISARIIGIDVKKHLRLSYFFMFYIFCISRLRTLSETVPRTQVLPIHGKMCKMT